MAVCSYLRDVLTTHNLLEGMGVGSADASAVAATLSWLVRDGAGMLSSLAFSTWGAQRFDLDVKTWRLFADVINDFALLLEFSAPLLPQKCFLPLLCVSAVCKAMCSVAAGCTRGVISQHFAGPSDGRNLSDVAAKESTQETAVRLLGLWAGYLVADMLLSDPQRGATAFLLLTVLHAAANYIGISCLALNTLNVNRLDLVLSHVVMAANAKELPKLGDRDTGAPPAELQSSTRLVNTTTARASNGALLFSIFPPAQHRHSALHVVSALQEYACLLESHMLTDPAAGSGGWLDSMCKTVCRLTGFVVNFAMACLVGGWSMVARLLSWCFMNPANATHNGTQQAPTALGLAALLPSPAHVAREEPLVPARAWSGVAHTLSSTWQLLQCRKRNPRCSMHMGASVKQVVAAMHASPSASRCLHCCSAGAASMPARDRAALNLALRSCQAGRSSTVVVQFGTQGMLWNGDDCKISVVLPQGCSVEQRFLAYATGSLLQPLMGGGLLAQLSRDKAQDAIQMCAAAASAAWHCFGSHAQQRDELTWAERWQFEQLLLPDDGWRMMQAHTANNDKHVEQEDEQDELDELLLDDEEAGREETVSTQHQAARARSTGRRRKGN